MTEILQKLIDLVQQSAPALWAIARKQVIAFNVQDIILSIIFLVGIMATAKYVMPIYKWGFTGERNDWGSLKNDHSIEVSLLLGLFFIYDAICIPTVIINIGNIIMRFINPDYYAIQILLNLVK
jgi:hypothetical protein